MDIGSSLESLFRGEFWLSLVMSFPIIFAFFLALTSKLLMGYVMSRNSLAISQALFLSLSVILALFFGVVLFGERVNVLQLISIVFISVGVMLVTAPKPRADTTEKETPPHERMSIS